MLDKSYIHTSVFHSLVSLKPGTDAQLCSKWRVGRGEKKKTEREKNNQGERGKKKQREKKNNQDLRVHCGMLQNLACVQLKRLLM